MILENFKKTGGGPAPKTLTKGEELGLSQNTRIPVAEGIPGVTSSAPAIPHDTSAYIRFRCVYNLLYE